MAYFGTDGNPVLDTHGVARWTAKYDEYGKRIELTRLDYHGVAQKGNAGH